MNKTKIMVINSRVLLRAESRQALNQLENAEFFDCAPGETGNNVITQIAANSPDIVLLDIGFPQLKGLEFADRIARVYPSVAMITLSTNPDEDGDEIFEVIKCGAVAYLSGKQPCISVLIDTIKQVCEGKLPISEVVINSPSLAHRIQRQFLDMTLSGSKEHNVIIPLTFAEEKILELIVLKTPEKQIAAFLNLTEDTVNNRVSIILKKMAANTRAYYLFNKMRDDLISVRIAKYGNLLLFNSTPASCQFQPSPLGLSHT